MTTICWHEGANKYCQRDHRLFGDLYFIYGRCRSGRRWFWLAQAIDHRMDWPSEHGWSDSEAQARNDACSAIARMAGNRTAYVGIHHGYASHDLKKLNAEKRRAKPPSNAKGSRSIEYLYSWRERYRIIKQTKQRVYYLKDGEDIDEHGEPTVNPFRMRSDDDEVGFITLTKLKNGSASGYRWLYPSLEEMLADERRYRGAPANKPDLAALKAAMANAHPDKGGSSAAFIEARQRYVAARRAYRSHA